MVSVNRQNPYYCLLWGVRQAPIDGKNVFSIEFLKIVSSLNGSEVFKVLGSGAASPRKLLKGRQWVFAFSYECHHHWSGLITQSEVSQSETARLQESTLLFSSFLSCLAVSTTPKAQGKAGLPQRHRELLGCCRDLGWELTTAGLVFCCCSASGPL